MKLFKRILAQLLFASAVFCGASTIFAQEGDPVGLILSTSGSVSAESDSGEIRQLRRRSPIFQGDTIVTSTRSRAQIRFNDNGLVALQPQTHFVIEQHQFNGQEDGTENAAYRLLRGGIQAITGLIGKRNKDRYRFETPLATIGLRGTHWSVTFCETNCGDLPTGLYGGVAEGGIDVCNGAGCEAIEKDDYFFVPDEFTAPQKLLDPPGVIFGDTTDREDGDSDDESDDSNPDETLGETPLEENDLGVDGLVGEIITENTEVIESQDLSGNDEDIDTDMDGVFDREDAFPNDPDETADFDMDGVGDNGDAFPRDPSEIADTDMDGVGDNGDVFPEDPTEVADTDMDGTGDNADVFPEDPTEVADTDMDGTGDNGDAFPRDPSEIADTDMDGVGDNGDVFPEDPTEVADTDLDEIGDNADPFPLYVTKNASTDSGVAFAGTQTASSGDVVETSGIRVELMPAESINVVLGLVGGVDNVFLAAVDTGNCTPSCELTVIEGELVESGGISDFADQSFGVNWGRWELTDSIFSINGVSAELNPSLHYAYSENAMDAGELNEFISSQAAPVIGIYSLAGGTSPTDLDGNAGSLTSVTASVDFFQQTVSELSIDLDINGLNYQAELLEETSINDSAFTLVGYVDGITEDYTLHGETDFLFLGDAAEGVLGSYHLNHIVDGFDVSEVFTAITPSDIVSGVYVLQQGSLDINPAYFDRDTAAIDSYTGIAINSGVATRDSLDSQAVSFMATTDFGHTVESAIVDGVSTIVGVAISDMEVDSDGTIIDIDCDPCVDVNQALLVESGQVSGQMNTIKFGRWNSFSSTSEFYDDSSGAGATPFQIGESIHYLASDVYSDGPSGLGLGKIATYSYIDGTSPTDEMNRSGAATSITAELDLYSQTMTNFSLAVDVDDRSYVGSLDASDETVFLEGGLGEFDLIGSCTGGDCGSNTDLEGQSSFAFVGVEGEYLAGGYGLNSIGHDIDNTVASTTPFISVNGVYVLESEGLKDNPDFFDIDADVVFDAPLGSVSVVALAGECIGCDGEFMSTVASAGSFLSDEFDSFTTVDIGTRTDLFVSGQDVFSVNAGVLAEYGSYTFAGSDTTASWGRWFSTDAAFKDQDNTAFNDIHFGYHDNLYIDESTVSDLFLSYTLVGGTSPTDENGNVGTLNELDLILDLYSSSIARFSLDLDIDDRNYVAFYTPEDFARGGNVDTVNISSEVRSADNSIVFYDGLSSSMDINLSGQCSGADCGSGLNLSGNATLNFIGGESLGFAEGVLGAYGLYVSSDFGEIDTAVATATGSFVLEQEGALDFDLSGLSSAPAFGVATSSYIQGIGTGSFNSSIITTDVSNESTDLISFVQIEHSLYEGEHFLSAYSASTFSASVNSGVVVDHGVEYLGRFDQEVAKWGLWDGVITFDSEGAVVTAVQLLPYAYAENITSVIPSSPITSFDTGPLASTYASYNFAGGTAFNESGVIISDLYVAMGLNLGAQELSSFSISANEYTESGDSLSYSAYYDVETGSVVDLTSAQFDVELLGYYNANSESGSISADLSGFTSVTLIGDNAEGAIGSFALTSQLDDMNLEQYSLAGAYVLEQYIDPLWFDSATDSTTNSTEGVSLGATIIDASLVDTNIGAVGISGVATDVELVTIEDDRSGILANAVVSGDYTTPNILGAVTSSAANIAVSEGSLSYFTNDHVSSDTEYSAYWGRWMSYDQVNIDGVDFDTLGGSLHFAYSEDLTDVTSIGDTTIIYSSLVAGAASNQDGVSGYVNSVIMNIDYGAQEINTLDIEVNINEQTWNAGMAGGSVSLDGSAISAIGLSGSVTDSSGMQVDSLIGNANTAILGSNADAVLGAYNMSGIDVDTEVVGTFLVEQQIEVFD